MNVYIISSIHSSTAVVYNIFLFFIALLPCIYSTNIYTHTHTLLDYRVWTNVTDTMAGIDSNEVALIDDSSLQKNVYIYIYIYIEQVYVWNTFVTLFRRVLECMENKENKETDFSRI